MPEAWVAGDEPARSLKFVEVIHHLLGLVGGGKARPEGHGGGDKVVGVALFGVGVVVVVESGFVGSSL